MAEALATIGVVASIVQLVHFGRRVLRRLDDCRSNFGEVPKTFQHVHTELPVLLDTLQRTQTLISDGSASDETRTALQPAIDGFRTQVEALDAIMKATTPTLGDSRATRTKKTILCLGKDAKVKAILSTMRGYTQTLTYYHATVASMPRIQTLQLDPIPTASNESSVQADTSPISDNIPDILSDIQGQIASLPDTSNQQFTILKSMLLSIQDQMATMNATHAHNPTASAPAEADNAEGRLMQLFRNLSTFSKDERLVCSDEAAEIIEPLEMLIDVVMDRYRAQKPQCGEPLREKRPRDDNNYSLVDSREIKRIKGLLSTSDKVRLNQLDQRNRTIMQTSPAKTSRRYLTYDLDWATVSIYMKALKHERRGIGGVERNKSEGFEDVVHTFTATLELLPRDAFIPTKFVTYLHLKAGSFGVTSLNPLISMSSMVPMDSAVFRLIEKGDLAGLLQLFQCGEASLRDCDPKGGSLLTYACYNGQPEICNFLIEQGCDVDVLEKHENFRVTLPLFHHCYLSKSYRGQSVHRRRECQRLLLEANIDTSLSVSGLITPLVWALRDDMDLLPCILRNSQHYIDVEERDIDGCTLLLQMFHSSSRNAAFGPSAFRIVLSTLGADINTRDYQGNSCLHLFFHKYWKAARDTNLETLVVLIRSGADIHAENNDGQTPYYTAQQEAHDYRSVHDYGSYSVDLWLAALRICGYETEWEAMGSDHKVRLTESYGHKDFEMLQNWRC